LITKVFVSVAITLGAALVVATPAGADPSAFGALGCSCAQPSDVPHGEPAVKDHVSRGMQRGLGALHGGPR
jgi:hypothetical protein